MNRRELEAKLSKRGVSKEIFPSISRLLYASNRTLIEFDGARSDTYMGNQGIIVPKINDSNIEFVGINNEGKKDTFIRIIEPRSFWLGYSNAESNQIEAIIAIQNEDGSIVETRAIPSSLSLCSPKIRCFSSGTVYKFVMENKENIEDQFDILFDGGPAPDQSADLERKRMRYRVPFEITKLTNLLDKDVKRKQIH
jgi:hypothetical protein